MSKGLKVKEGFNVNLKYVCAWLVEKEHIQLHLACSHELSTINIAIEDSEDAKSSDVHKVTINEFKRLEREIAKYMAD
jgi:hypothetical protein